MITIDVPIDCPHADACGGCAAIALPYAAQLARKHDRAARALARYRALEPFPLGPVAPADPIVGYRTRAKLAVSEGRVGLYRRGTHDVVDIPSCRVLRPAVADAVASVREALLTPPDGTKGVLAALLAIDVREAVDAAGVARTLVTLVVDEDRGLARASLETLAHALAARVPGLATVAVSRRARQAPQLLGRDLEILWGDASVPDAVQTDGRALEVLAVPGAFAQAHRGQAHAIRRAIEDTIATTCALPLARLRVADVYAGAGALGLGLAARGAKVTLIESFNPAMALAARAAARAGLGDAVVTVAAEAAAGLETLEARPDALPDVVVLNPPRRGVSPAARVRAARLRPRLVFYVSCEPETLARDLAHLALLGYGLDRTAGGREALRAFDMIPLTDEVETLAVLVPAAPPPPHVLFANDDIVVVDKDPHEPTTPHPEHPSCLLDRVRGLSGCAEAVPLHRLDAGTSGVCAFARRPDRVARYQAALGAGDAIKVYRVLARGIARDKGAIKRPLPDERGVVRAATTRYRRLEIVAHHSLLDVRIETGRTHQIRRHLASLGHPVVGDERHGHGPTNRHFAERYGLDRPFLHAARLELDDPTRDGRIVVEAPLAGDLAAVLARSHASVT